jgi:hypothetical protein
MAAEHPTGDFFPYHPLKWRLFLLVGVLGSLGLMGWAVAGFAESRVPLELLRASFAGGLGAAMGLTLYRFRPRAGWGVQVTPRAVLISRPRGGVIEVPWASVKEIRRLGEKRETLALWLEADQRVLVPAHLFARRAQFEAMAARLDERRPAQPHQS